MKTKFRHLFYLLIAAIIGSFVVAQPASSVVGQETETEEKSETDQDDETADDIMREAQRAAQQGDLPEAIGHIERAVKLDPKNIELKLILANVLQQHGMMVIQEDEREDANEFFYRSAEVARELMKDKEGLKELGPQVNGLLANIFYNEACTLALDEKKQEALSSLEQAFELGFDDFELVSTDSDLDSIRESEAFASLLENQKKLAVERLASETKEELASFESFEFDFELEDTEGNDIALSDFKGKVLIVDFWGTWCPPCRAEIPSFIKLKENYGSKGFDIVGLNNEQMDDDDKALVKIKEYMEDNEMNYRCALSNSETEDQVDIEGFPTTLFIDTTGKVRLKLVGLHEYEKLESIVKQLMEEETGG